MKLTYIIIAILAIIPWQSANAKTQAEPIDTIIKTVQVADNIYMLVGEGGNIGVLRGEDKTIIIDSQFSHVSEKLQKAIGDISSKPIAFLLNTHFHFDHTGGNEDFAKSGAYIIAHKNVRTKLKNGSNIVAFDKKMPPSSADSLPIITYDSGVTLHIGNEEIELLHYPNAHTNSDTVVFFKTSNVIHTGDIYFNNMYPFIDVSNGGSVEGLIAAQQAVIDRSDEHTKIIAGHGALANRAKMQKDLVMLKDMHSITRQAFKQEQTIESVLEIDAVKKYATTYEWDFISTKKFIEILYSSYK